MKLIHFDSTGGASGDMILGSLISLGADIAILKKHISAMLPHEEFDIELTKTVRNGISGIVTDVKIGHSHSHGRSFSDIKKMIETSALPAETKEMSIHVFRLLAEAEAKIHGSTPEKIHFHEVGAVDSIIDIIGSCLAFELLGAEAITFSPLPLGHGGTIKCQHGIYPLPAPATVELLKGVPVYQVDEPFETVTPTGAALLTGLPCGKKAADGKIISSSYSFGHRELNTRPNLLRATVFETDASPEAEHDSCIVLETNIDDISPEIIGALYGKLLDAGALDVFTIPVQMKKQRPGFLLTVLCHEDRKKTLQEIIFRESSTFGIREKTVSRRILARRYEDIETPFGKIKIKIGSMENEDITFSPEMEDCMKLSEKSGKPLKEVYESAILSFKNKSANS
ncbi:MAG: TIGR00299 family protein [Lentisphaerae bacterium GWF2_44_16]|nr:MAG: TIGR00299 family protein [Lentisphaerae bacterium GWF2_44_16]